MHGGRARDGDTEFLGGLSGGSVSHLGNDVGASKRKKVNENIAEIIVL